MFMDILTDTNTWYLISFTVFVAFTYSKIKNFIIKKIDERIESIQSELETSEALRVEAQELLAQYQRKYRDVLQEAESIVSEAKERAEEIRKQAAADLNLKLAQQEKNLETRMKVIKDQAVEEVHTLAAELALKGTEKIIKDNLSENVKDHLISQSIQKIGKTAYQ